MRSGLARAALMLVLVVGSGSALELASPPSAEAQATRGSGGARCSAGWRSLGLPTSARSARPLDVVARNGKLAWIVGGGKAGILLLQRGGGGWLPRRTITARLAGLSAGASTGASSLVAVGYDWIRETSLDPIGGTLTKGTWRQSRVPHPRDPHAALADVAVTPSGRAWAVGTRLASGRSRPLVLAWNGSRWKRDEPSVTRGEAGTVAVTRAPDGTIWIVGWQEGPAGRWRPLILNRKGSPWRAVEGAPLPEGSAVLTDVDFARGDGGWATGYLIEAGTSIHRPILQRWDGVAWVLEELPWADGMSAVPRALSVTRDGHVWIAGTRLATDGREPRGFVAHRDAVTGTWRVRHLGVRAGVRSEMLAIAATRGGAVASGTAASAAVVLRSCRGGDAAAEGRVDLGSLRLPRRSTAGGGGGGEGEGTLPPPVRVPAGGGIRLSAPVAPRGFVVRDVAGRVGLAERTVTYGGLAADFDGDGWTDVFYARHGKVPRLLRGSHRGFRNARQARFGPVDRHGCAAADIDRDGQLDLFCTVGRGRGSASGRHEVSLRPASREAELAREALGAADPFGRGRMAAFMDLEGDGWPDLFVVNVPARTDGMPATNRFFRNVGGRFVAAPEVGLDRSHGGACLWTGDLDGDGDDDLVHCVDYPADGRPPGVRIYLNEGGRLDERSAELGARPIGDVDALLADVTGDGRLDLVQLGPRTLRVSRGSADGFERIYQARVPGGVALAAGDVDGDARADLYILRGGRRNRPDLLLVSRERGDRFVSVRIPQAGSGRGDDAIALDHDRNGLTDFLVLNGWNTPGPVQLLASFRRPR
ncbi:hypothetical protein BH23CHL8_BH23CHL8_06600 [soil metagenome]